MLPVSQAQPFDPAGQVTHWPPWQARPEPQVELAAQGQLSVPGVQSTQRELRQMAVPAHDDPLAHEQPIWPGVHDWQRPLWQLKSPEQAPLAQSQPAVPEVHASHRPALHSDAPAHTLPAPHTQPSVPAVQLAQRPLPLHSAAP